MSLLVPLFTHENATLESVQTFNKSNLYTLFKVSFISLIKRDTVNKPSNSKRGIVNFFNGFIRDFAVTNEFYMYHLCI